MSAEDDDGPGTREVAHRLFAAEFEDSDFSYAESDEERAPNYVVTPTGARVNRLFAVGVLTEVEAVGEDVLRARVVDPTGAFVVYAGQYQPDAQTFLERAQPPAFVAVTGKARTFQPDDSDVVYTSIRPESVNEVDAETRDRWVVGTAERTLDRIGVAAAALESDVRGDELAEQLRAAGVDEALAAGLPLAIDHYGTTGAYLTAVRELALDAARVVAGEREEVGSLSLSPGDGGPGDIASLASLDLESPAAEAGTDTATASTDAPSTADSRVGTAGADDDGATAETDTDPDIDSGAESTTDTESVGDDGGSEPTTASEAEATGTESTDSEPAAAASEPATDSPEAAESTRTEPDTDAGSATESDPVDTEPDDLGGTEPNDLGDSEPAAQSESLGDSEPPADDDIGDFEPGEFDLDEEVREEVESEYGTDFQSGTEVEEPGEADIETPDPEDLAEAEADAASESASADAESTSAEAATSTDAEATESESGTDTADAAGDDAGASEDDAAAADAADEEAAAETEPDEDIDLEDAVMDAMADLDEGDGADREAVIDHVADRTGADSDEVEDAIQNALMDGRCYEPDDATLKPI